MKKNVLISLFIIFILHVITGETITALGITSGKNQVYKEMQTLSFLKVQIQEIETNLLKDIECIKKSNEKTSYLKKNNIFNSFDNSFKKISSDKMLIRVLVNIKIFEVLRELFNNKHPFIIKEGIKLIGIILKNCSSIETVKTILFQQNKNYNKNLFEIVCRLFVEQRYLRDSTEVFDYLFERIFEKCSNIDNIKEILNKPIEKTTLFKILTGYLSRFIKESKKEKEKDTILQNIIEGCSCKASKYIMNIIAEEHPNICTPYKSYSAVHILCKVFKNLKTPEDKIAILNQETEKGSLFNILIKLFMYKKTTHNIIWLDTVFESIFSNISSKEEIFKILNIKINEEDFQGTFFEFLLNLLKSKQYRERKTSIAILDIIVKGLPKIEDKLDLLEYQYDKESFLEKIISLLKGEEYLIRKEASHLIVYEVLNKIEKNETIQLNSKIKMLLIKAGCLLYQKQSETAHHFSGINFLIAVFKRSNTKEIEKILYENFSGNETILDALNNGLQKATNLSIKELEFFNIVFDNITNVSSLIEILTKKTEAERKTTLAVLFEEYIVLIKGMTYDSKIKMNKMHDIFTRCLIVLSGIKGVKKYLNETKIFVSLCDRSSYGGKKIKLIIKEKKRINCFFDLMNWETVLKKYKREISYPNFATGYRYYYSEKGMDILSTIITNWKKEMIALLQLTKDEIDKGEQSINFESLLFKLLLLRKGKTKKNLTDFLYDALDACPQDRTINRIITNFSKDEYKTFVLYLQSEKFGCDWQDIENATDTDADTDTDIDTDVDTDTDINLMSWEEAGKSIEKQEKNIKKIRKAFVNTYNNYDTIINKSLKQRDDLIEKILSELDEKILTVSV